MTKTEALKLALEALEYEAEKGNDDAYRVEREAIREALAQPEDPCKGANYSQANEQEPVKMNDGRITLYHDGSIGIGTAPVPTNDTSQERVDKTEKQRHEQEPVIDKSAAVRIATALGWEPKRTWAGLTDEEIKDIIGPWGDTPIKGYTRKLFDQIEAKLRSKNT